jgi:hypothetical protein
MNNNDFGLPTINDEFQLLDFNSFEFTRHQQLSQKLCELRKAYDNAVEENNTGENEKKDKYLDSMYFVYLELVSMRLFLLEKGDIPCTPDQYKILSLRKLNKGLIYEENMFLYKTNKAIDEIIQNQFLRKKSRRRTI